MAVTALKLVNVADTGSSLDIRPVAGRIGAEIRGVALSGALSSDTVSAIRAALLRHKVIFFRDQTQFDDAAHEAFAALLGEPVAHPTVPVAEGSRYMLELDTKEGHAAANWHTDVTFLPAYPAASILRSVVVPEFGGDTLWANTAVAYERLPTPLKALADGLHAIHSNLFDYAATFGTDKDRIDWHNDVFASTVYETEHPVVRIHPETGEHSLLLSGNNRLVGFNSQDSNRLIAVIQDHITKPENTVRWNWRANDVAIWDNRATQHRAIADFANQHRHMRRATVAGDVPVGIDGFRSRLIRSEKRS